MAGTKKQAAVPSELGNITQDTVDRLEEKLSKCYSEERHSEFQDEVKKIVLNVLGHDDGKEKIKACAKDAAKAFYEEDSWRKLKFWLPVIISTIFSAIAVLVALFKK